MGYHFELDTDLSVIHPRYGESEIGLRIDGIEYRAELFAGDEPGEAILELGGQRERVWLASKDDVHFIHLRGRTHRVEAINALGRARRAAGSDGGENILRSPMPGIVVEVAVEVGAAVRRGERLMTIESMKLQTAIHAERDAIVAEIFLTPGCSFDQDTALVRLEFPKTAKEETPR